MLKLSRGRVVPYVLASFALGSFTHVARAQDESAPAEPAPAYDQTVPVTPTEPPPPAEKASKATELTSVEVTGSRLKRTDYETAAPVAVISREDIDRSGLTSISEILSRLTAAGNDSLDTQAQSVFLTGGETNLDLRNLGPQHTLILVNGHRWVSGLISTTPSVVDLNTIPTAIIERIEILKDGASAVYGSDAIAGVVNIITRKDYNGLGIESQYGGFYEIGDGTQQQHQISYGFARKSTSIFANLSYTDADAAYADRRAVTHAPYPAAGNTRWGRSRPQGRFVFVSNPANAALYGCPGNTGSIADSATQDPGGFVGTPLQPGQLPGTRLPAPVVAGTDPIPAGLTVCDITLNDGAAGTSPNDFHYRNEQTERFNFFQGAAIYNPSKREAGFVQLNQNLADWLDFSADAFFNHRDSRAVIGNLPIAGGDLLGGSAALAGIKANNQYNQFIQQDVGIPDPAAQLIGSGFWTIRDLKQPSFHYGDVVNTLRVSGTLKSNLELFDHLYSMSAGYIYARSRGDESTPIYRNDLLGNAVGAPSDCTGDCVPFNAFGGADGITDAMLNYIYFTPHNLTRNRQDIGFFDFTTDLGPVHLPAGPINVAVGFEWRREQYLHVPDPLVQAGVASLNIEAITAGQDSVREEYAEIGLPLLSDLPLINSLDVDLAARFTQNNRYGAVTTGKIGARWKPYEDLLLRSTYSSGFRAPNIGELFLGDSESFDSLDDPCVSRRDTNPTVAANCQADGVPANVKDGDNERDIFGGNEHLVPERSRGHTIGLVFSPRFVRDLNLSVDFYRISIKGFITVPPGQFFLDSCYAQSNRTYCDNIHRNSDGTLDTVATRFINYSAINTAGIDTSIDYRIPVSEPFGRLKLVVEASYLKQYDTVVPQPGQADQTFPSVGVSNFFIGYPRWKGNAELIWKIGHFNASWLARMVWHMNEPCFDGQTPSFRELGLCSDPKLDAEGNDISENRLHTTWYNDVQIGYTFDQWSTNFVLGINNVLNQDPPTSYNTGIGFYNYDPTQYDTPGRFGYMRLTVKF